MIEDMRREECEERIKAVALRMLETDKYALEEIASMAGLSLDEVKRLQAGQGAKMPRAIEDTRYFGPAS